MSSGPSSGLLGTTDHQGDSRGTGTGNDHVLARRLRRRNANALGSRDPIQNRRRYRPITYGSSHIQAVSFLPRGRTDARTILTYGQSENPRSPYSSDQTRLFSKGKWVRFAWTDRQIRRDLVRTVRVSG
jgi:acyl-homoserine-lactone acylase